MKSFVYTAASVALLVVAVFVYSAFGWHSWTIRHHGGRGDSSTHRDDRGDLLILADSSTLGRLKLLRLAYTTFPSDAYRSVEILVNVRSPVPLDPTFEVIAIGGVSLPARLPDARLPWYMVLPTGIPANAASGIAGVLVTQDQAMTWQPWCRQRGIPCVVTSGATVDELSRGIHELQMQVADAHLNALERSAHDR